jgi:hypothetical protein
MREASVAHTPSLAPPEGYPGPRRSLVLAGGGMRVAYQAGAMLAMEEAGLCFAHADGASGGTMNLGMLLSGLSPKEMCERWRTLDPKGFMALLPLKDYVRSLRWPALGAATGVSQKVFPHLGIDVARIRGARGITGTFNVCNYTRMIDQVIEHTDIDPDLLVAGVSLPMVMPAISRGGEIFTDAVWIRDANPLEAIQRGAEEVWLIWCIGNTPGYHNGVFRQYVHMIEMAANGSLFKDFERVNELNEQRQRPAILHVVKPRSGIPLDPDYILGRIDAATLCNIGYQDARAYLDALPAGGIAWDAGATRMAEPAPGVTFRLTAAGPFALGATDPQAGFSAGRRAGTALGFHLAAEFDTEQDGVASRARLFGQVTESGFGDQVPLSDGVLVLDDHGRVTIELTSGPAGEDRHLSGVLIRHAGQPALGVTVHEGRTREGEVIGAGVLPLRRPQLWELATTLHATNAPSAGKALGADLALARRLIQAMRG